MLGETSTRTDAEAHIGEKMDVKIDLLEKPMYGLQEQRIPELEPLYTDDGGEAPHALPKEANDDGKRARGKRLELDGYCESAKIAFEFQGAQHLTQHYERNHLYHRGKPTSFDETVANDKAKVELCKLNGVKLIVVPLYQEGANSRVRSSRAPQARRRAGPKERAGRGFETASYRGRGRRERYFVHDGRWDCKEGLL